MTKRVLSLFLSFLISDLIFFSFILSLSYLIFSYPLFCSLCYLFSPLLRLSSLLSSTLIYLLLFFLFFSFCSVALLLSFLSDFILSYLILFYHILSSIISTSLIIRCHLILSYLMLFHQIGMAASRRSRAPKEPCVLMEKLLHRLDVSTCKDRHLLLCLCVCVYEGMLIRSLF